MHAYFPLIQFITVLGTAEKSRSKQLALLNMGTNESPALGNVVQVKKAGNKGKQKAVYAMVGVMSVGEENTQRELREDEDPTT